MRPCAARSPWHDRKITFGPGIAWDEFVIVSGNDIPGENYVALISDDQPCLADDAVNHPEEPILLLAHPTGMFFPKQSSSLD